VAPGVDDRLGIAWASIIALPYAMLANTLPSRKMGVNIGIFNFSSSSRNCWRERAGRCAGLVRGRRSFVCSWSHVNKWITGNHTYY
jgi:hypothetical protein